MGASKKTMGPPGNVKKTLFFRLKNQINKKVIEHLKIFMFNYLTLRAVHVQEENKPQT